MADLASAQAAGTALEAIRARTDQVLVEPEGYPLLSAYGIACPRTAVVTTAAEAAALGLESFPGGRLVVKIATPEILHRSDVGGVRVVEARSDAVAGAIADMAARLDPGGLARFTVNEFVPHRDAPGHQLLVGLRWTDDFGPVVVVAPGGIHAEFWARALPPADAVAMFPTDGPGREGIARRLARLPFVRLVTERQRGEAAPLDLSALVDAVEALQALGRRHVPGDVQELEINPLAVTTRGLVALDVLVRRGAPAPATWPPRPLDKLAALYRPQQVGIVGVSEKGMNVGRIILGNLLRDGFPPDRITVVKPGPAEIDGCRCVAALSDLGSRLDLLVLAISAAQVPAALTEITQRQCAESVIVIPGGLEEKAGTEGIVAGMREALLASRDTPWRGPVVNGGNCLGLRSRPGHYDTLFIPTEKLPVPDAPEAPLAFVSQSGAFAIARASRLATLNPRYLVTAGNQMDLSIADHLEGLSADEAVRVFAVYVEGFRPLDGRRVMQCARRLADEGRTVVLYRAGRTAAGAQASASHTASIAGDYAVTREMASAAGVLLAESLDDFEDLVVLATRLAGCTPWGTRVGAISNAGFECVAFADALGALTLADLSEATRASLFGVLRAARIDGLVDVHNPLDLTPMADDGTYEAAVRAMASDPGVDVVVVGCVPLTAQLDTLPTRPGCADGIDRETAVGQRLARVFATCGKPMVVVVDSGALYDPMADGLARAGVPVFRAADRALRALNAWTARSRA